MKKISLLFWIAMSFLTLQSTLVAHAQLCSNPSILNFGSLGNTIQNTGVSQNQTYGCKAGNYIAGEKVFKFDLVEKGQVTITLSNIVGPDVDLFLLSSCTPVTCVAFGATSIVNQILVPGTYFVVVDGLLPAASSFKISLSGSSSSSGHCFADFIGSCTGSFIDSVTISSGSTSFKSIKTGCSPNSLKTSLFISLPTQVFREGSVVTVDARLVRNAFPNSCGAWIDFNNNGSFDDANEFLGVINNQPKSVFTFTIPSLLNYGQRRLRIRNMGIGGDSPLQLASTNACTNLFASGETEDYILNLEPKNCTPKFTASCASNAITSFTLKQISNLNSGCSSNLNNHTNYPESQFKATLSRGVAYTASAVLGSNVQSAALFIDYNGDGDFLDANEFVGNSGGLLTNYTQTFTVPSTASFGLKKLRIRSVNSNVKWTSALACSALTGGGETEDYVVNIVDQSLTITNGNLNRCRGELITISWTNTGDFLPGNRLFAQFSGTTGLFSTASANTEIELVGNSPQQVPIPSNLTAGAPYKVRVISTNPSRVSGEVTLSIPTLSCSPLGLSTGRIGTVFSLSVCKGTSVSVPFSSVNIPAGSTFKVQISGPNGALPFTDVAGATRTTSPITALIPLNTPTGDGYKVRVVGPNNFTQNTSPTVLNIKTCLSASLPTSICKGFPTILTVSQTGIPAGTTYRADLIVPPLITPGPSTTITVGTSSSLSSITITIPCSVFAGTGFKLKLVPTNAAIEAGTESGTFTVADCPMVINPPSISLGQATGICLGSTFFPQLNFKGCTLIDNAFFVDFLEGSATGTVIGSVPLATNGSFTMPDNFPVSNAAFVRLRSTSPVATSTAVGPFVIADCPRITINSICRTTCGQYVVDFTAKGTFGPGNQFKVQMNSQFGNPGPTINLGNPGNGSPLIVPVEPNGFPFERRVQVLSTNPVVESFFLPADGVPACAAPTVTVTGLSTVLTEAGPATNPPTATVCIGQKLRVDFTTTGVFCPDNLFFVNLGFAISDFDFSYTVDGTSPTSPIIVTIGPFEGNINPVPASTTIRVGSTNPGTLTHFPTGFGNITFGTNCPTITTGVIANTNLCASSTISVPFTKTGTFNAGNTFSAELSDANGSFANPIALVGSRTTSPLSVTLPTFPIDAGTGYRIRVKSSSPEVVGLKNTTNLTLNPPVLNNASVPKDPFIGDPVFLDGTNLTGMNGATFGRVTTTFSNLTNSSVRILIPVGFNGNDCQVKRNGCLSNIVTLQDQVQAATNFNLFNAATDENLGVLKGGSSIDLTDLTSFNIRGNLNSAGFDMPGATTPGSVKIVLTGPVSQTIIDNNSPFTLFGETVRADGSVDFLGSTLPVGNYTITATPYASDNAVGHSGTVWTTAFAVAPPRTISTGALAGSLCQGESNSVSFVSVGLFKPESQYNVELSDASGSFAVAKVIGSGPASPVSFVVPASQAPGSGYRIRVVSVNPSTPTLNANSSGAIAIKLLPVVTSISESVVWADDQVTIQGSGFNGLSHVLFNGLASGNFSLVGNQNNKLKARVPTGATSGLVTVVANGGCTSAIGIGFTVPKITSFSVVNTENQVVSMLEDGGSIPLNANPKPGFIATVEPNVAGSVRFELSGPTTKTVKDNAAPFSFCGDSWNGTQTVYNSCTQTFPPGVYTLTATPSKTSNIAKSGEALTIEFTIGQTASRMAVSEVAEAELLVPLQLFPNPTSGQITIKHSGKDAAQVHILNMLGQSVLEFGMDQNETEKTIQLDKAPAGIYLLQYRSGKEFQEMKIIKN